MSKKISDFFTKSTLEKRKADDASLSQTSECSSSATKTKSNKTGPEEKTITDQNSRRSLSASLKTVLKWQKELNITLGQRTEDNNVVEIWCTVCREHAVERTSSVS